MFIFKRGESIIVCLHNYVCVCVKKCLWNKKALARSIWLLCQSYFHSLVRARIVKLISNMPCVPIVLNLQPLKHNERSKKNGKNVWTAHYPICLISAPLLIRLAKQLKLHIGETCLYEWRVTQVLWQLIYLCLHVWAAALCWPDASPRRT